jgi:uncharacterized membrane protein YidH (DUF202 family)
MPSSDLHERAREGQALGEEYELRETQQPSTVPAPSDPNTSLSLRLKTKINSIAWTCITFWSIAPSVPSVTARDHLATERVFLAYIRTSNAFANFAVVILQLYRLKGSPSLTGGLSDYDLGIPLSVVSLSFGVIVAIVGAVRFFRCQKAMLRKRVLGSGLIVNIFSAASCLVSLRCFGEARPHTDSALVTLDAHDLYNRHQSGSIADFSGPELRIRRLLRSNAYPPRTRTGALRRG